MNYMWYIDILIIVVLYYIIKGILYIKNLVLVYIVYVFNMKFYF